jgi:hypothetical protein
MKKQLCNKTGSFVASRIGMKSNESEEKGSGLLKDISVFPESRCNWVLCLSVDDVEFRYKNWFKCIHYHYFGNRKIPSQGFYDLYTRERIAAWTVQKHSTILNAENTIESILPKSILLDALLLQLPGIRRMFGRVSINIHQGFFLFKDCNE